jgi:1,5-anhydro-D-fructose reductase (1,5-anhydro-D-mannitol-forming)
MLSTPGAPSSAPSGFFRNRTTVRWGIIGCGDVTEVKSGPGFQKADGSQLVAVMRRNAARAADYARRHGIPRWYDNVDALLADPEVDAVYIATPPEAHLSCALRVAAAKKPAYVEKPMARNTAECDAMIAAFRRANVPLFVAYYRRRLPRFLRVHELLRQGAIGAVTGISYNQAERFHLRDAGWRIDATSAGGGHFLDVGSHTLDLCDLFFGPLECVQGVAANLAAAYAVEDSVAMSFRTRDGVPGTATWNFSSAVHRDVFRVTGTEGEIEFSVFDSAPIRLTRETGDETFDPAHPPHVQQPLIQTVVDDLLGRATCPSTGETARRTSVVMDAVLEDYYAGRHDAFWDRPQTWRRRPR